MNLSLWPRRRAARLNHRAHLEGVLGTALELQIAATSAEVGPRVEAAILAEIDRLETICIAGKTLALRGRASLTRRAFF